MPGDFLHFMQDAVYEGQDAHGQRYLGTLLQMEAFVLSDTQTGLKHLLGREGLYLGLRLDLGLYVA